MTKQPSQSVSELLQLDHHSFQYIVTKVEQFKRLNHWLKSIIDPILATRCQIGNIRENCLILITDSAITSTQIRLQTTRLLEQCRLNDELKHITQVQCKVRFINGSDRHTLQRQRKKIPLSQTAAHLILESARNLKDQKLRAVMERIARRNGGK